MHNSIFQTLSVAFSAIIDFRRQRSGGTDLHTESAFTGSFIETRLLSLRLSGGGVEISDKAVDPSCAFVFGYEHVVEPEGSQSRCIREVTERPVTYDLVTVEGRRLSD